MTAKRAGVNAFAGILLWHKPSVAIINLHVVSIKLNWYYIQRTYVSTGCQLHLQSVTSNIIWRAARLNRKFSKTVF